MLSSGSFLYNINVIIPGFFRCVLLSVRVAGSYATVLGGCKYFRLKNATTQLFLCICRRTSLTTASFPCVWSGIRNAGEL